MAVRRPGLERFCSACLQICQNSPSRPARWKRQVSNHGLDRGYHVVPPPWRMWCLGLNDQSLKCGYYVVPPPWRLCCLRLKGERLDWSYHEVPPPQRVYYLRLNDQSLGRGYHVVPPPSRICCLWLRDLSLEWGCVVLIVTPLVPCQIRTKRWFSDELLLCCLRCVSVEC